MGSIAPNGKHTEASISDDAVAAGNIDDADLVDTIVDVVTETLDEATGSAIPIAELHGGAGDEEYASDYWDASSMAPLNAVSAVSIVLWPALQATTS